MEVEWHITFSMDICDWFFQKVELRVLKVCLFFFSSTINEQLFIITHGMSFVIASLENFKYFILLHFKTGTELS